ncbi:RNA polymerase sigma factor [Fodinicola feengrottensis]|uniref:RNA polymerase sigma factor n=1 Tax=Fodinicola feengrottensis TaxID=435914 RepID=UPI0031CE3D2C
MTNWGTDDVDLLRRISMGDHEAFGLFFRRHHDFCIRYACRIIPDAAGAEDVVQDVFLSVWTGSARFQAGRGRAVTWLRTIVHHRAIDHIRRSLKEKSTSVGSLHDLDASASGVTWPSPFQEVWTAETVLRALDAVNGLPRRQQELIVLAYFRGYSQTQIAAATGIPLGTVKTRTITALRALKRTLGDLVDDRD